MGEAHVLYGRVDQGIRLQGGIMSDITTTRRRFVGAAAVAGIGVGLEAATARATTPQEWNLEADIVVCGLGIAGIGAAMQAAQDGARVIVLEKQPPETAGGDTMCNNGGVFWTNTMVENLRVNSMGEWDEQLCQEYYEEGLLIKPFLEEGGATWMLESDQVDIVNGLGPAFYEAALAGFNGCGAEVHYETPAKKLVCDPKSGEVLGVLAEKDGKPFAVKAAQAVVLTTGGYPANQGLLKQLNLGGDMDYYSIGSPYLQGDGLKMACSVGASLANLWRGWEPDYPVCKAASEELGTGISLARPEHFVQPSYIYVNGQGKRYWNESTFMTHWKNDTYGQVAYNNYAYNNKPSFLVFDQACFEAQSVGNTQWSYGYGRLSPTEAYIWSDDNSAELERGWIKKADTLEELAELAGIDPEGLVAEVERYNGFCTAGLDEDFGRTDNVPLGAGPYYAIEQGVCVIYTIGGLRTDAQSRVLDWNGEPIPRLYSAGNIGQGVYVIPIGLQGAWIAGRRGARDAVTLEPWG